MRAQVTKDPFVNFMAFQAGLLEFEDLLSLSELKEAIAVPKHGSSLVSEILALEQLQSKLIKPEKSLA